MSDKEEKSSYDEGTMRDGGTKNPETTSTLDSIKKIEDVSGISQNMPRSGALEGSGDKIESALKEMTKEFTNTDAGKENGDNTAQTKACGMDDQKIEYINTGSDLNDAKSTKTDVIPENVESNDENKLKKIDDHNEHDDEMELRWDDDDSCNVAVGDDSRNLDTKNNDVLSEDQLLEEPSDDITKEMSELHSDENSKESENDLVKDNSEECSLTGDKISKDAETTDNTGISPERSSEKDIPTDKADDENTCNILEDKHFREIVTDAEMINSPEMDYSSEESLDHDIKILEDKLLEEEEQNIKAPDIDVVRKITVEKDNDELLEENDPAENNVLKDVSSNDLTKENLDDIFEEDKLLAESESENEAETATSKMPSLTDVILNQVNDNVTSVKNLLEDSIPAKATESSEIILENKDKEDSNDVLLEEKLLEESETAGVISETDASMDVDDEQEGELLKDDESEDGICTPMDVDITGPSIENQVKMDDKNVGSSMVGQSEVVTKDADPIGDVDRSDDEVKTTVKVNDQPIEDTTKSVVTSKDTTIEEKSQTADINKEIVVEEKITPEIEEKGVDEPIDDKNREEDNNKDQSTEKPNTTAQSDNSSKQTDIMPISKTLDVVNKEIKNKIEPEKPKLTTEDVNPDNNLEKNSEVDEDNEILDETHDTDEISYKNYSKRPKEFDIGIKTGHGLHEPDVMLEIPTQELIDMDDTDFSMNLDQSEVVDSIDDIDEEVEQEETTDKIIFLDEDEKTIEKTITENVKPSDQTVDKDMTEVKTVIKISVDLQAAVTEKTADDINSTVNKNAVVTDPTVSKLQTCDIVESATDATSDIVESATAAMGDMVENATGSVGDVVESAMDTRNDITESATDATGDIVQNATGAIGDVVQSASDAIGGIAESATDARDDIAESAADATRDIVKSAMGATDDIVGNATSDKVKSAMDDIVVCKVENVDEATVEENMERMFADVVKEVSECGATTMQDKKPVDRPSAASTQMTPDTSDEVPEISDSLGLLAESAGRMMDDEEPEDDDDEDDDFDQDESSNQISAEQSEDSNPAALESEPPGDQEEKNLETPDVKDEEFEYTMKMEVDIEEYGTLQLQAESMHEMNEETKSAVDALLRDNGAVDQAEEQQVTTEQMDIETVKLSDTSDYEIDVEPTVDGQTVAEPSKEIEERHANQQKSPSKSPSKSNVSPKQSPSKLKNLAISTQEASSVVNIVDLEESSSSEDEIQEVQKEPETTHKDKPPSPDSDVTNVNIPTGIEIMCTSGGNTSEITTKEGEVVISGVPKPPPHKPARLNTSEVSIKTVSATEPIVIPETKMNDLTQSQSKPKLSLEIFNLDSDEEDSVANDEPSSHKMSALELDKAREINKCINYCCKSDSKVTYKVAEPSEVAFYDASRKKRCMVCQPCADMVANRSKKLMQGIKDMTPIMDLEMGNYSHDLVQISDSESEDEEMVPEEPKEPIGEKGAKFIEDNLAKYLNDTWKKYDMDVRLKETQIMLDDEIERLEQDSKEIDAMLSECQIATDKLRNELYATFEYRRQDLPPLILYDTPETKYIGLEEELNPPAPPAPPAPPSPPTSPTPPTPSTPPPIEVDRDIRPRRSLSTKTRRAKRRLSSTSETPAKRPAIPLGYATLDSITSKGSDIPIIDYKIEDDIDVSVVKLSAEAAPADLPPPGEISRPPLRVSMHVYAMKNAFGPWLKGKVLDIQPKNISGGHPFSLCRVKFDHKNKNNGKVLPARCIAYSEPADVRMTIGTRLIALFRDSNKREAFYSGVVSEIPTPMNNFRYLVFFDDGYAQYVQHQHTRLVCESCPLVWEEVHPFSREFVRKYLLAYPERPMVRLHEGQHLKTEWNGKWWSSRVTRVDASLAQVMFVGDGRREWIYRGSTRLAPLYLELRAALRHRVRPMPRSKAQPRSNMPYVEYTRSDEPGAHRPAEIFAQHQQQQQQQQQQNEEMRRQRAVAKKSTSAPPQVFPPSQQQVPAPNMDPVTSRVVYYTPKNAVKPLHMVPHRCTPKCKRNDVLSLKELRTYNPLAKPLLSGWERQIIRFKGHKEVMYRAPCGRRLRNMRELHAYLCAVASDLPVDLFDFHYSTHCLAEFVLNKCLVGKKDLSHGKENVPVPCVNYYDDSLPEFCSYNTERTPTAGVPLNLSPDFLCGCDCTDDCQDKSKCACWKMTLEGARTIGLKGPNVGYVYKRLPEPLPSGIYECNSRCKCKQTCLNRVAQHPLQLKLQVFKTPNRGWGIRALNDVPKGSFLCVYAGNLLTDATANLDGLNEGDEYLAELDYIEVVEQMKEGYEEDIPDADKKLDKKDPAKDGEDTDDDEPSTSEEEDTASKTDKEDDDFRPGYIGLGVTEFNKRLRRREKLDKEKEGPTADEKEKDINKDTIDSNTDISKDASKETTDTIKQEIKEVIKEEIKETKESNGDEDCITISDDEEVREPSRFMVQDNMKTNEYISKYKSVRTLFGSDEACYIMDAKVQGNIGRYLNHSCCPNVFVQNVFVDTHDPRFPWVAFFALSHIKAGTELTWNYNYDVGSVPGKILYCYCGAPTCRGRLL